MVISRKNYRNQYDNLMIKLSHAQIDTPPNPNIPIYYYKFINLDISLFDTRTIIDEDNPKKYLHRNFRNQIVITFNIYEFARFINFLTEPITI